MKTDELFELLQKVWARELSVDEAWELIDSEREMPPDSTDYWLPLNLLKIGYDYDTRYQISRGCRLY